MALQGWLSLLPVTARRMWRDRWAGLRDRAHGGWELASVATAGLAIVTADLKIVFLAVLFWGIAIGVYLLMTGLVVWRAMHDPAAPELVQPDMWILMGGGVPTWDVLGRHICHGRRNRQAVADGAVAGVLLDRVRGVGRRR
ncbi:MAG: hypothetical protein QOC63_5965 [Mycobacterium sp.]|jgi:hypothetical protein|nr:hypothetical protein [Mycobacterium sp.]